MTVPPEVAHLSTTLPDLILSMTMTCLLRWLADVSVIPSVAPGDLMISTSSGPEAFATVSDGGRTTQGHNHHQPGGGGRTLLLC